MLHLCSGAPGSRWRKGRVKVKGQFCGPGAMRPQVRPCLAVVVSLSVKSLKNTSSAPSEGPSASGAPWLGPPVAGEGVLTGADQGVGTEPLGPHCGLQGTGLCLHSYPPPGKLCPQLQVVLHPRDLTSLARFSPWVPSGRLSPQGLHWGRATHWPQLHLQGLTPAPGPTCSPWP